ncbi:helix-turn-helix transcriptional regulator [Flavobacterium inviolabile]|uniref:helix-turn-helix transcriptional regulator n=1 Tax=Flavobacterium inviolabile TaxID=2748320 RepID=UPI0015B1113F|nr:YafY family protein [Flavobacterium inviolabile]
MNRFDRITAILIQLQSRKVVKAQDLADRFDISLRTVYRDIRTLEEAGVPLYGEAGVGYSIVDGYRLPPVMFTQEEAMAFITAEKLMEKLSDSAVQNNFQSAMYKIKSVLRGSEKELVEGLERHIHVREKKKNNTAPGNSLDVLLKAISEKRIVKMTYRAFGNEENTERLMEPIGIYYENEYWYTVGYCHYRNAYRHFRADRMVDIFLTEEIFRMEHASLQKYQEQKKQDLNFRRERVIIKVDKNIAMYLQERKHYYGFVSEVIKGNEIEMTFLTDSLYEGFARWYIMFADYAEIIEPASLNERIIELAEKILQKK